MCMYVCLCRVEDDPGVPLLQPGPRSGGPAVVGDAGLPGEQDCCMWDAASVGGGC